MGGLVWVAWMFITVGAICATLAAIGFYAGHFKIRRLLGVYNACVVLVLVVCCVVSVTCWVLTGELNNHFEDMTPADIQDIPCRANFEGCCCCGDDIEEVSCALCISCSASQNNVGDCNDVVRFVPSGARTRLWTSSA